MLPHDEAWAGRQATWRQQGQLHETLRKEVEACEQNRDKLAELERLTPLAEQALKLLVAERQAFTSRIIGEIAEEVGRLYEAVHPGEGLDKISLPLDPKKRASLGLQASFGDGEAPPQAYFSQSHLDTLGLCVFLALALRERASETILILDDVLGSVDEPHVERVIEMVYEVSTRFRHTIVTTHYRPWRVKFNWGELRPGKPVNVVDLTSWNLERGIQVTKCIPEVDRLAALLSAEPQDVQAVTSKAGVILEQALDHLTRKYECRMPRHDRGYTLGDLLDAVSGKLRTALKVERRTGDDKEEIVELGPILDRLKALSAARNVLGAHFNVLAQQLTGREGVEFAEQVLRLADALVCPEHGWPTNDKSGSYWKNSGDTRRLHPLRTPG